jgi:hypothetical protein
MDDDQTSTFSYDNEDTVHFDTFSVSELQLVVEQHFETNCRLKKLAEGGYHKASRSYIYTDCYRPICLGI